MKGNGAYNVFYALQGTRGEDLLGQPKVHHYPGYEAGMGQIIRSGGMRERFRSAQLKYDSHRFILSGFSFEFSYPS